MRQAHTSHGATSATAPADRRPITLGVVLAGRRSAEIVMPVVDELEHRLASVYPSVRWQVTARRHHAAPLPRQIPELLECGRKRLLKEGWNLALVVTDLPLRANGRPIASHVSPTHGVAILSLPALGPIQSRRRLTGAVHDTVAALVGERAADHRHPHSDTWRPATLRRLGQLAAAPLSNQQGRWFAMRAMAGHARLLAGMVIANRPWRLAARLYRGLVAALAFVCFSVVNPGVWQLAATMGLGRLALAAVGSLTLIVVSLILVHRLWERAESPRAREQVVLFNAATSLTLLAGVLTLYLALLAATFVTTLVFVPPVVLGSAVHRAANLGEYLQTAWLVSSLATVGGALGAALESDAAVRDATYSPQETAEHEVVDLRDRRRHSSSLAPEARHRHTERPQSGT